jgi:hypothetical protein
MSPDGKLQNLIDQNLIDRRRRSRVLGVRSSRAADCDTDNYLVVAKIRGRIALNKQESLKFHKKCFSVKKFNEGESKEKYRVEVSNRFAALEDLEVNTIWETIREERI